MGTPRSPLSSPDFYSIFGMKTACKAYKSLVTKFQHNSHSHHHKSDSSVTQESNHDEEEDSLARRGFRLQSVDDSSVLKRRSSLLSRTASRRSHTPQARPTYLSSSSSSSSSRRSTNLFSRSTSRREDESSSLRGLKSRPLSKSTSRRDGEETIGSIKGVKSPISSPREDDGFVSPITGLSGAPSSPQDGLSGNASRRDPKSVNASPIKGVTNSASSPSSSMSKSTSRRERDDVVGAGKGGASSSSSSVPLSKSTSMGFSERDAPPGVGAIGRSMSRRSPTPIVFSQSVARRKPPPKEKKLECSLEELCNGGFKNLKITRDVITDEGIIVQKEETLRVNIKPGWKKGTKITFVGKGNEKPGYLPEDIIFVIEEKKHPLFKRRGDDLEIAVEIPLLKALTGCTLSVPLLGGEKMALSIEDIVYPGFEKTIQGQGMPKAKEGGKKGDLRITFLVEFPEVLSQEQRSMAYEVLKDCSWS